MNRRTFLHQSSAALATTALSSRALAQAKPKTVVLQSAWDTVNIGDIGHTPGTLRIIEQHLPDVQVILWAMKLDERVTAMLRARFPKVEIVQGSLTGKTAKRRKAAGGDSRRDLFIRNSGMGQDTSFMEFCQKIGKPYGLYGQSYFPDMVEGKGADERIALLNGAAFIYSRETKTLDILKGAGVKPPVLEFGPDGCFGIDVRDDARGLATMKKLGLEERKFITIQLRTTHAKLPGVDDKRPQKLNPLHPTPEQIADDERRAAMYRDLITRWVKKTGYKVLIAPEVKKEMEHNKRLHLRPAAAGHPEARREPRILSGTPTKPRRSLRARTPSSATSRTRRSSRWRTARRSSTPTRSSTARSAGCSRTSACREWLLEFDSTPAAKMAETLFAIDADYPGALAKVKKAMAFVHECFGRSMQVVKKIIKA